MPPGGETFRFSPRFGENVLRHGSHEWLPYSVDEARLKSPNTNLSPSPGGFPLRIGGRYGTLEKEKAVRIPAAGREGNINGFCLSLQHRR